MFVVFGVDYLDRDNKDFFDENDNIKYNINIDDMPNTCFFVAFMNTEKEAKKFCEVRNQYNKLQSDLYITDYLYYYSYCKYYEDQMLLNTIIEMKIQYKTYLDYNEIEISFYVNHPDRISKTLLDEFIRNRWFIIKNVDNHNSTLFIIPKENESPEDLLNRCLGKCVEFIKNYEFKDDGKIYTYKDFLEYHKEKGEGGIYYSRWGYTDMIHIEDRFKD